jgi:hypothetical protein
MMRAPAAKGLAGAPISAGSPLTAPSPRSEPKGSASTSPCPTDGGRAAGVLGDGGGGAGEARPTAPPGSRRRRLSGFGAALGRPELWPSIKVGCAPPARGVPGHPLGRRAAARWCWKGLTSVSLADRALPTRCVRWCARPAPVSAGRWPTSGLRRRLGTAEQRDGDRPAQTHSALPVTSTPRCFSPDRWPPCRAAAAPRGAGSGSRPQLAGAWQIRGCGAAEAWNARNRWRCRRWQSPERSGSRPPRARKSANPRSAPRHWRCGPQRPERVIEADLIGKGGLSHPMTPVLEDRDRGRQARHRGVDAHEQVTPAGCWGLP